MKVLFASGGSGGPVAPLLAVYEELASRDTSLQALWLGTKNGPEKNMVAAYNIPFQHIISGKRRQYFSLANFFTPVAVFFGFIQSLFILRKFKPQVVLTAGSFVAVPVVYAAWLLGVPRFIHQQDLEKGLANKLMAKKASYITVVFRDLMGMFDFHKTFPISNPVRKAIWQSSKEQANKLFNLQPNLQTIFIVGGGQGAQLLNQMVLETVGKLTENFQIIHHTGEGKSINQFLPDYYDRSTIKTIEERYHSYEFLNEEIFAAYTGADLVISRAGMGTLTELSVLGKPAILIPLPGHQELNAQYFAKFNAVKVINQNNLNAENFLTAIQYLLGNQAELQTLSRNISKMIDKEAAKNYVDLIYQALDHK